MLKGNGEPKAAVKAAAKTSIFENLQREALLQLHPRRAQQGANRLGRSALAANDFSKSSGCTRNSNTVTCDPSTVCT